MYSKDTFKKYKAQMKIVLKLEQSDGPNKKGCLPKISMMPPIYPADKCGDTRGSSIVVKDRKIYTTGYFSHKVCKYNQSNKVAVANFKKKVGVSNPFTENTAIIPIYIILSNGN